MNFKPYDTMKIERIELKLVMNTKRRNNTSSRVEMKEHNFTLRNKKEVQVFDDTIEDHAFNEALESLIREHVREEDMFDSLIEEHVWEEDMFDSLIEEHVFDSLIEEHVWEEDMFDSLIEEHVWEEDMFDSLKEDMLDSIIKEHVLEEDMFDSLIAEQLHYEDVINDDIEYYDADGCDYDSDYDDYPYENEIGIDLAVYSPQFEYDDSEDSSCCFEMGYYNDCESPGIFGGYDDKYNPEFVPSFRHINNF